MRNLKITKILLSLMLMFGLATSSFAAGGPAKGPKDNKPKIEKKVHSPAHKKEVKVVKVYKDSHHHKPHHHKHHDKVVYYSNNNSSDIAAACIGTGICLAVLAAAINS
ncbi:MAG: hypothetical protein IKN42_01040 [Elusimicrobia bacterium]|nr:hypothetical protein [Elusimicrobiota bacterium]